MNPVCVALCALDIAVTQKPLQLMNGKPGLQLMGRIRMATGIITLLTNRYLKRFTTGITRITVKW
jgi:hypothetical protein